MLLTILVYLNLQRLMLGILKNSCCKQECDDSSYDVENYQVVKVQLCGILKLIKLPISCLYQESIPHMICICFIDHWCLMKTFIYNFLISPLQNCTGQEELDWNEVLIKRYVGREVQGFLPIPFPSSNKRNGWRRFHRVHALVLCTFIAFQYKYCLFVTDDTCAG